MDERTPIVQRYPELSDIESKDNGQKLETYRFVLESLQRELDDSRD
jgi:hypothetical protein